MYKTPALKSEKNKKANPFEGDKASDPSLPRSPDFPEIDISDMNEYTAGKIEELEIGLETPLFQQIRDLLSKENEPINERRTITSDSKVNIYGWSDIVGDPRGSTLWVDTPTTVNKTVYGGLRLASQYTGSIGLSDSTLIVGGEYLRAIFVGYGDSHTSDRFPWYNAYFVTDPDLISQVSLTYVNNTTELILPVQQSYTNYTRVYLGADVTYIETVVGGRSAKKIPIDVRVPEWVMTQPPPNCSVTCPADTGNYEIYHGIIDNYIYEHEDVDESAGIVIKNYSAYPRLFKMATHQLI